MGRTVGWLALMLAMWVGGFIVGRGSITPEVGTRVWVTSVEVTGTDDQRVVGALMTAGASIPRHSIKCEVSATDMTCRIADDVIGYSYNPVSVPFPEIGAYEARVATAAAAAVRQMRKQLELGER